MICEYIEECRFLTNYLQNNPQQTHEIMEKFCKNEPKRCARYLVMKVLGVKAVPEKLFPDMQHVAVQLIKQAENLKKKANTKSTSILTNVKADDIFDFVLDLISESTEQFATIAYKIKDQETRKFTLWVNNELQIHYANVLQLKLQTTGIRGRKRGKNPLMLFIENIRRNKEENNSYIYKIKSMDDSCQLYFSAFKTRIALLKGLRTKNLTPEIITSIDCITTAEEIKTDIDNKTLIAQYHSSINP